MYIYTYTYTCLYIYTQSKYKRASTHMYKCMHVCMIPILVFIFQIKRTQLSFLDNHTV